MKLNSLVGGNATYDIPHLKTKWKNIKSAWKLLYGLRFVRRSGLGWDSEKETIVGTIDQLEAIYAVLFLNFFYILLSYNSNIYYIISSTGTP